MRITAIEQQARRDGWMSVFVDGKYSFSLPTVEVQDAGLSLKKEYTKQQIDALKKQSEDAKIYSLALSKCLRRPHSVAEVQRYLRAKSLPEESLNVIIEKLKEKRYIDDNHFAEFWFDSRIRTGKSLKFIEQELRQKGVGSSIISRVIGEHGGDDLDSLRKLHDKVAKRYSDTQKLMRYLATKGFSYDDIKKVLDKDV